MDIEKLLDQLLVPSAPTTLPSFDTPFDLYKDTTESCLNQSHNSSTTNSSNCSWMSESSCDCHSPRSAVNPKSSLIFHKKSILPPLLCTASRNEMQVYKHKALEREQRRQNKYRSHLISRVEAILSSIDSNTTLSTTSSQVSTPILPQATSTASSTQLKDVLGEQGHGENPNLNIDIKDEAEKHEECETSSKASSLQDDAYRLSLQNLLHKSLTMATNLPEGSVPAEPLNIEPKKSQASSSESSGNGFTNNNLVTVIANVNAASHAADTESSDGAENLRNDLTEWNSSTVIENVVESAAEQLVNSVLEGVMKEFRSDPEPSASLRPPTPINDGEDEIESLTNMTSLLPKHSDKNVDSFSSDESPLCSSSIACPYYSPRKCKSDESQQFTSCKATEQIDKALQLIESKFGSKLTNSDLSLISNSDKSQVKSTDCSSTSVELVASTTALPVCDFSENKELSYDAPTPETKALLDSYIEYEKRLEEEEELSNASVTHLIDVSSNESSTGGKITASSSKTPVQTPSLFEDQDDASEKSHRVRRDSYSLDAPSPFLISSRDAHTVYSADADDEQESQTTEGSISSTDVKRRLDMKSDSEESWTTAMTKWNRSVSSIITKDTAMSDYCKMLEEQHKREMKELKSQQELQLAKFKKKLLYGQSNPVEEPLDHDEERVESLSVRWCASSVSTVASGGEADEDLHRKWCKLSALIKGYLTRRLLATNMVQTTMQTIRDTSRTILMMREEDPSSSTSMTSIQDATLMNRLFSQLKAALYDLHETFFEISVQERMDLISRSRSSGTRSNIRKVAESDRMPRLSAATMKSLERKKSDSKLKRTPAVAQSQTKEIKSKISYIWKNDNVKKVAEKTKGRNVGVNSSNAKSNHANSDRAGRKPTNIPDFNKRIRYAVKRPLASGNTLKPVVR